MKTIIALIILSLSSPVLAAKAGAIQNPNLPETKKLPYAKIAKHECTDTATERTCITLYSNGVKIKVQSKRKR